ncbi:MAG: HAMP domain-containing histidine kinase [Sphingomonas sp.]|nr:HAMP domain-containing histidine kinase [Sphingomonas sp.]
MRRFLPKSLIGQIALVMAVALLVAQAINFSLIFTERQRVSRAQIEGPAASRFVMTAQRLAAAPSEEMSEWRERRRRGRYVLGDESVVPPGVSDPALVARLRESAATVGLTLRDARAISGGTVDPPQRLRDRLTPDRRDRMERRLDRLQTLILSIQLEDGRWVNARVVTPRPNPWLMLRPLAATLLTYAIILAAMLLIAARIARPLRDLAGAADRFRGNGESPQVEPRGPADVRRAILAFNAMSARVGAMLDEKDRMLGAIGHDLRTPLASLRIRAESVEPEEERARMIATIEEMTSMLDDTLALARTGRGVEQLRAIDVTALADTVVEEFHALGQPVEMAAGARAIARIQPNLIRRAVRNLIENAVKYAGAARIAVRETDDRVVIEVTDDGPGIPASELANVQDAFYRIEPSRSRETGGSGLGLTLARAAAQAHGGDLELANRAEGGLVARILLPRGQP